MGSGSSVGICSTPSVGSGPGEFISFLNFLCVYIYSISVYTYVIGLVYRSSTR